VNFIILAVTWQLEFESLPLFLVLMKFEDLQPKKEIIYLSH